MNKGIIKNNRITKYRAWVGNKMVDVVMIDFIKGVIEYKV